MPDGEVIVEVGGDAEAVADVAGETDAQPDMAADAGFTQDVEVEQVGEESRQEQQQEQQQETQQEQQQQQPTVDVERELEDLQAHIDESIEDAVGRVTGSEEGRLRQVAEGAAKAALEGQREWEAEEAEEAEEVTYSVEMEGEQWQFVQDELRVLSTVSVMSLLMTCMLVGVLLYRELVTGWRR